MGNMPVARVWEGRLGVVQELDPKLLTYFLEYAELIRSVIVLV